MQNLKITFTLSSPVILDRTTTIDGILLSAYYSYMKSKGNNIPFDKEHKTVNFIYKEKGVFSGSVWYINKDEDVSFDFESFVKKPEYKKIFNNTGKRKVTDAQFKAYLGSEETMIVDNLYFYIKGNRNTIKSLLEAKVFGIGKKQSVGFGTVKNIFIEEIEEDKGFILNSSTPSKPLPIKDFQVDTVKVAQMRRMPPYWLEEDLEPCYMPTSSLYENTDCSAKIKEFNYIDIPYEHNCTFLYALAHSEKHKTNVAFKPLPMKKIHKVINTRGSGNFWIEDNSTNRCSLTKKIVPMGVKNNIRDFIKRYKQSFGDYGYFTNDDFLSKEALWNIENINEISYSYADRSKWLYLQGSNAKDGTKLKDFLKSPFMLEVPFSINLKDTQNAQHVSFKGKVSISNAFFIVQYGDTQLQIDNELLQQAILDIKKIVADKKITKTHLCGAFDKNKSTHPVLKREYDTVSNNKIIMNFQKKYNSHIRLLLARVKLD